MVERILFVTTRNIINTCGELRLIKNRAQTLFQTYNIPTDFVVLTSKEAKKPEEIRSGGSVKVFRYSRKEPASYLIKKAAFEKYIFSAIRNGEYCYVILSGAPVLPLIKRIKDGFSGITLADSHGAYEELIEFHHRNWFMNVARHFAYRMWKGYEKKYLGFFDYVLAVSNSLKRYLIRAYKINAERIQVVPCSICQTDIQRDNLITLRQAARAHYGIDDKEQLFIYSGGTSKWQCIEETVTLFQEISKKIGTDCRLLLLSGDRSGVAAFQGDNIIIDSLSAEQVRAVLPAGDYAFLLRDDYTTNRVAFPNKYMEYVVSGLKVITTVFLEDIAHSVQERGIGYVMNGLTLEDSLIAYLQKNHSFADDIQQRQELIDDICFESRLSFISSCGKDT